MPTVQIADDKKYGKAIGLLLEMGGIFRTKPTRQLVIGPAQLQALGMAGLVPKGILSVGGVPASGLGRPGKANLTNKHGRTNLNCSPCR
jgi:hypothetical protein